MRDPNRLYNFYNELMKIHMEQAPDWRFGQFLYNIFAGTDPFYLEEDDFLNRVKSYFNIEEDKKE